MPHELDSAVACPLPVPVFLRNRYLPVGKPTGKLHHSSKDFVPSQADPRGDLVGTATTNIDDAAAAGHAGATGQGDGDDGGSTDAEGDGYATGLFNRGSEFVPPVVRVNPAVPARATAAATTASGDFEYMTPDGVGAVAGATVQEGETFGGFGGPSQEVGAEGASRRSTLVPGVGEVEVFDDFEDEEGAYVTSLAQLAKVLLGIAASLCKHAVVTRDQQTRQPGVLLPVSVR